MKWRFLASTWIYSQLLNGVSADGATVSIAISYCPATSTLASGSGSPTPTATPYLLQVQEPAALKRAAPEYIAAGGTVTPNPALAIIFTFSPIAQLIGNGSFVSTTGGVGSQNFSPNTSANAIQTTFSINPNSTLDWSNDAFVGRHALFCSFNSIVQVVFNQQLPVGCNQVLLEVIPLANIIINGGSTSTSQAATGSISASMFSSSSTSPGSDIPLTPSSTMSSPTGTPTTTGTPNCIDGSDYDGSINAGYLILCDTDLPGFDLLHVDASSLDECIEQCNTTPQQGSNSCIAVEFDILAINDACTLKSNVGPVNRGDDPFAQAAILATGPNAPPIVYGNASSSSTVSSSATAASSIYVPSLTGSTTTTSSSSSPLSLPALSSSAAQIRSSVFASTSTRNPSSGLPRTTSTPVVSPPTNPASSNIGTSQTPAVSPSTSLTVQTSTTFTSTFTAATSTLPSSYPTPTATPLCTTYNHQVLNVNGDGYNYEIECSTQLQGSVLSANSTTATSLSNCVRFCTVYNVALPYGCVGVNYVVNPSNTSPNCLLLGAITGSTFSSGNPAARLIYPGYPSPTDPNYLTTSTSSLSSTANVQSSTSVAFSNSSPTPTSMTSSIFTVTSTTLPTTSPITSSVTTSSTTPFSQSHCPAPPSTTTTTVSSSTTFSYLTYTECPSPTASPSGQCFYYDYSSDPTRSSSNYEIECATFFTGSAQQPLLVTDFHDCISWCAYANRLVANSCIALTYLYGQNVQGGNNNCFRYSTISCANRTTANLGVYDSARLLYGNYPAISDYQSSFNC